MHTRTPNMAPEGLPIICLSGFTTLLFAVLGWPWLAMLGLAITGLCLHFFRDPERVVPDGPGLAICPADGRVVKAGPALDPIEGRTRPCVSVFMNVFNVHVNRVPVEGQVQALHYYPGKFLSASLDKSSEENERLVMRLKDETGNIWTVVQIAGLIARRIVCHAETGDTLRRGQRYGLIKFGSRVDLYLPDDYEIRVTLGDTVFAGQTVVATRPQIQSRELLSNQTGTPPASE